MPISAITWDNATKTLTLNEGGRLATIRNVANDIFIDAGRGGGEVNVGKLTGNTAVKKQKLIDWVNLHIFTFTIALADLGADDPDKTVDPDLPNQYWGDADGVKNPAGLFYVSKALEVYDFDETLLAADDLSGISTRRIR